MKVYDGRIVGECVPLLQADSISCILIHFFTCQRDDICVLYYPVTGTPSPSENPFKAMGLELDHWCMGSCTGDPGSRSCREHALCSWK